MKELCAVSVKAITETAIQINHRQTLVYLDRQALDIKCKYGDGTEAEDHPMVEGLIQVNLTMEGDCHFSTHHRTWRSDNFLETSSIPLIIQ